VGSGSAKQWLDPRYYSWAHSCYEYCNIIPWSQKGSLRSSCQPGLLNFFTGARREMTHGEQQKRILMKKHSESLARNQCVPLPNISHQLMLLICGRFFSGGKGRRREGGALHSLPDSVVDDGVHAHCHRVPGEDLGKH
jgi:hypothetical protein